MTHLPYPIIDNSVYPPQLLALPVPPPTPRRVIGLGLTILATLLALISPASANPCDDALAEARIAAQAHIDTPSTQTHDDFKSAVDRAMDICSRIGPTK